MAALELNFRRMVNQVLAGRGDNVGPVRAPRPSRDQRERLPWIETR